MTPDGFALGFDSAGLARIVTEKIVLQNDRNAQQHLGVDASAFEDVVDVGSLAIKFPREPAHRAFLPPEFRLDQFADMYHAVTQKKARTNSLSTSEVLDDPCNRMSGNARAENSTSINFSSSLQSKVSNFLT